MSKAARPPSDLSAALAYIRAEAAVAVTELARMVAIDTLFAGFPVALLERV